MFNVYQFIIKRAKMRKFCILLCQNHSLTRYSYSKITCCLLSAIKNNQDRYFLNNSPWRHLRGDSRTEKISLKPGKISIAHIIANIYWVYYNLARWEASRKSQNFSLLFITLNRLLSYPTVSNLIFLQTQGIPRS